VLLLESYGKRQNLALGQIIEASGHFTPPGIAQPFGALVYLPAHGV
jgi:hypothetical protein